MLWFGWIDVIWFFVVCFVLMQVGDSILEGGARFLLRGVVNFIAEKRRVTLWLVEPLDYCIWRGLFCFVHYEFNLVLGVML